MCPKTALYVYVYAAVYVYSCATHVRVLLCVSSCYCVCQEAQREISLVREIRFSSRAFKSTLISAEFYNANFTTQNFTRQKLVQAVQVYVRFSRILQHFNARCPKKCVVVLRVCGMMSALRNTAS